MLKNPNDTQWNIFKRAGNLYQSLKDGTPKWFAQKAIGYGYPIILVIIAILNAFLVNYLRPRAIPLLITSIIGSFVGYGWGIWLNHYDSHMVAWIFHPWAYTGIYWILALEDWIFYPVCGIFFCLIMDLVPERRREHFGWQGLIIFLASFASVFFFFLSPAGAITTLCFAFPGILMWYFIKWFDARHFLICFTFFVAFACLWDYWAVTWMHDHYAAWSEQWAYVLFDAFGNHTQSTVFTDFKQHPYYWIGNSPIEITPWFSIAGTIFIYPMYKLIKQKFN